MAHHVLAHLRGGQEPDCERGRAGVPRGGPAGVGACKPDADQVDLSQRVLSLSDVAPRAVLARL